MELGEHAIFQPQDDHLVLPRKEVVCILSVLTMRLLKLFSPLPFFINVSAFSNVISCTSCSTFPPSVANLEASSFPETLQWDVFHCMDDGFMDCCSVASDETSVSIYLFLGPCSACKPDKTSEKMTPWEYVASFYPRSNLAAV